jgi:hypothetical protein
VRTPLAALLLLAACKEGPSEAQLATQRKAEQDKLCAANRDRIRAQWEQLGAIAREVRAAPPVEKDELPQRPLKLRELHLGDSDAAAATADTNYLSDFEGPKRGITGSCLHRLEECRADDTFLEPALSGCTSLDSAVLVRPVEEQKPRPFDNGVRKYTGGFIRGEAFVYALAGADGGKPVKLGAFRFATRLTGEVEIYRDFTSAQIEQALSEGLRKSAWSAVEERLATAAARSKD